MAMRFVLLAIGWTALARAHDPITTKLTWSQEISRIIYKRCVSCHYGAAQTPMSLLTYEDARPWAKAIKEEVLERRMPLWGAMKGFGEFLDDASLSQDEIMRIAEWVEGGAPEGDPKYLPMRPSIDDARPPVRRRALRVRDGMVLARGMRIAGIRPRSNVQDARITATRPDGSVEPLIWLHGYKKSWQRTFAYREPVALPRNTRIQVQGNAEVEFAIATSVPKPAH